MKHKRKSASPCDLKRQRFRDRLNRQEKRTGLKYPDEFCHSSASSFCHLDSESALFVYSVYSVVRKALRFDFRFRRDFPKRNLFPRLNSQIQIQPETPPAKKRRNVSTDLAGTCLAHILARFLARNGTLNKRGQTITISFPSL